MKRHLYSTMIAVSIASAIPAQLYAGSSKNAVYSVNKTVVVSTNGNCVRTKWTDNTDPCAAPEPVAAPAPAPVPQEPQVAIVEPAPAPVAPPPPPEPQLFINKDERTIFFAFDSDKVSESEAQKLSSLATAINSSQKINSVKVVGYTDQFGSDDYNSNLSKQRVESVMELLKPIVSVPVKEGGVSLRAAGKAPSSQCLEVKKRNARIECMQNERRVEIMFEHEYLQ